MKRSILFDTETTGLDPNSGDRIIEIAALELCDDLPTGEKFHVLIDPERDIPAEATRVHGFTQADLAGKPVFAAVAQSFLDFVGSSTLIAHNAAFDMKFLNAELQRAGYPPLSMERAVDTLELARARFPGMPNSLDALCRRFSIDLSARTTHNALLDCQLLAEVYVELTGGRQRGLVLTSDSGDVTQKIVAYESVKNHQARTIHLSPEEKEAHRAFVGQMKQTFWSEA